MVAPKLLEQSGVESLDSQSCRQTRNLPKGNELHRKSADSDRITPHCRLLLGLLLLSAMCSSGCGQAESPFNTAGMMKPAAPTRLTVNVAQAKASQNVYETSVSFGIVKPARSSSLGFSRGGQVATLSVDVGDYIDQGETIAALEQGELSRRQQELDEALANARSQLSAYQSQNNRQQVAQVQQDIARLTAQQEELAQKLSEGLIVAPYRAQLAERSVEIGDTVPSGRPVVRIYEDATPIAEVNLPTAQATKTAVGQEVWIKEAGELLRATVVGKSPEVEASSRTQRITLQLPELSDNADWTYGQVVEVQFWDASENSGIWLPYSALQRQENGLWTAYVIEGKGANQTIHRRILEVVQLEAEHALVRGSLKPGEFYVVDGLHRLVPGQQVVCQMVQREFTPPGPPGASE